MTKISVLMPVYNTKESFLKEAIESILNQTEKDFEFIIINDGSTINVEDIILSCKDSRIKYVLNENNLGLIKTLNKGLGLAKGEYIARMDADDISLPDRLEKQLLFMESNPDTDILGTWFKCFPRKRVIESPLNDKDIKQTLLVSSNMLGHPTIMFRTSTVKKLNILYDEKANYVEDYALWLSLIDKVNFACVPEILLNYRLNNSGICKNNIIKQNLNCQKFMFEAQGKYFNIDFSEVDKVIEKLKIGNKTTRSDVKAVDNFVGQIKQKMKEENFSCRYEINKEFYKYLKKKSNPLLNLDLSKLLWNTH